MHRRFLVILALAGLAIAVGAPACSNQAEGERCDSLDDNNGNDDCASGLICYPSAKLGGTAEANGTDICCPSDRGQATTSICALSPTPPGGNPAPPDAGTPDASDAGTTDAPSDSPADSPSDSPADAPLDSPVDAPLDSPTDAPLDSPTD